MGQILNKVKSLVRTLLPILLMVLFVAPTAMAQSKITVTGTVTDASNKQPLIGASVSVEGTTIGTTTDLNGKFTLQAPPTGVLEVQYLGYTSIKEKINSRKTINIILSQDNIKVDEVVVIGYGAVAKSDLTGSVTNVKMSEIADAPVTSVDQALQGRVAGADIMSTTGEPGASTSIRIRGTRSITASNEPLIVVDGVMDGVSDLGDINPADIKSISVLKDASSTAIYGARGANGVIIVTTKGGSDSGAKPRITFKADLGFSQLPRKLDVMNASEFARYRNDVYYMLNSSTYPTRPEANYQYPNPEIFGKGTDWQDVITRTGLYQNYNLSVSGGTKKYNYFASFGYHNNQGIIICSGLERYTGRFNASYELFKWLRFGLNFSYEYRNNDNNKVAVGGVNYWNGAIFLNPMQKPTDTVNILWGTGFDGGQPYNSPYMDAHLITNETTRKLCSISPNVNITLAKGLTFRSRFNYYVFQRHTYEFYPSTRPTYQAINQGAVAYRAETDEYRLTNENTLTYKNTFRRLHAVDLMVGFTVEKFQQNNFSLKGTGYLSDDIKWNNMSAIPDKNNLVPSSSLNERTRNSFLGRFNYNYKKRYYVTFTARVDGSSNFAANNKYAFFPSGAFKWMVSKEPFMKSAHWIDDLSLRLSAGMSGNDAISYYRSMEALSCSTSGYLFGSTQPLAVYPSRLESKDLTWEKTAMYNAAVDFAVLRNRLEFSLEAYYSKTTDLLLSVQLPTQTGFSSRYTNIGATENKGVEFSVTSHNFKSKNFSWNTTLTIAHNRQKVLDTGSSDFIAAYSSPTNNSYMMYGYVNGYPLNALWGFKHAGVWHSQDEINRNKETKAYVSRAASTYKPGYAYYVDTNHDGTLNEDDLVYLGSADPIIYGGLQNTFHIGKFRLSVYFNYSLGGKIYNLSELWMSGSSYTNQYRYMLDAWHPVRNPESNIPAAYYNDELPSSRMVYDASYLRLKNISLGYTFDLRKRTKLIRDITVSASGENIFLWKNYNGYDPDVSTNASGSTIRRMDNGAYPKARTFIFSVQIRY